MLELGETLLQWLALCAAAEVGVSGGANRAATMLRHGLAGNVTMERWIEILAVGIDEILEAGSVHDSARRMCLGDKQTRDEVFAWLRFLRAAAERILSGRDVQGRARAAAARR